MYRLPFLMFSIKKGSKTLVFYFTDILSKKENDIR